MTSEQYARQCAAVLIEMYGTDISGKWMSVSQVMTMLTHILDICSEYGDDDPTETIGIEDC